MERDLIRENGPIFVGQGKALPDAADVRSSWVISQYELSDSDAQRGWWGIPKGGFTP